MFSCTTTITTKIPIYRALEETENKAITVMTSAPWNGTEEKNDCLLRGCGGRMGKRAGGRQS